MSYSSHHIRTATGGDLRAAVVALPAEMDVSNEDQVRRVLGDALRGGARIIVADASGTSFCGCAGVTALIHAHLRAAAAGAQLRVAAGPPVRRILELTRADRILASYPTLAAALREPDEPGRPAAAHPATAAGLLARMASIRHAAS